MDQTAGNGRERLGIPMVEPEIVKQLRALRALGWGTKRLARELGMWVPEILAPEFRKFWPLAMTLPQRAPGRQVRDGACASTGRRA